MRDDQTRVAKIQARKLRARILEIVIDHLPDRRLSPNARVHWTAKHSATSTARAESGWLAKKQWIGKPPILYAIIDYEFTVPMSRRRDQDNLIASCKPWQDGLIDAGVLVQDDSEHLKLGSVTILKGPKGLTRIHLTEIAEIIRKGG